MDHPLAFLLFSFPLFFLRRSSRVFIWTFFFFPRPRFPLFYFPRSVPYRFSHFPLLSSNLMCFSCPPPTSFFSVDHSNVNACIGLIPLIHVHFLFFLPRLSLGRLSYFSFFVAVLFQRFFAYNLCSLSPIFFCGTQYFSSFFLPRLLDATGVSKSLFPFGSFIPLFFFSRASSFSFSLCDPSCFTTSPKLASPYEKTGSLRLGLLFFAVSSPFV